jgi:hypothetical protein
VPRIRKCYKGISLPKPVNREWSIFSQKFLKEHLSRREGLKKNVEKANANRKCMKDLRKEGSRAQGQ